MAPEWGHFGEVTRTLPQGFRWPPRGKQGPSRASWPCWKGLPGPDPVRRPLRDCHFDSPGTLKNQKPDLRVCSCRRGWAHPPPQGTTGDSVAEGATAHGLQVLSVQLFVITDTPLGRLSHCPDSRLFVSAASMA